MGSVILDNPGPADYSVTNGTSDHVVAPQALVHLRDSSLLVQIAYNDLDTLDETIDMLRAARKDLTERIFRWRGRKVLAVGLGQDDELLEDGRRLLVDTVVIDNTSVTISGVDATTAEPYGMCVARDHEFLTIPAALLQVVR